MTRARRVWNVTIVGVIFGALGLLAGSVALPAQVDLPRPYTVPFVQGGSSLRIAMIHDVLHERYSKHGPAWYRERERRCRAALEAAGDALTDEHLRVMDDLAVALDRLGRPDEATEVLRRKVAAVERLHGPRPADGPLPSARARFDFMATRTLGPADLAWYRTSANLGTTLVHGNFAKALTGDAAAKERLREGLTWVRRSIATNPGAHFGREVWQAGVVGFLLAACDDPSLFTRYDLIGQTLAPDADGEAEDAEAAEARHHQRTWWRSYLPHRDLLEAWTEGRVSPADLPGALDTVWRFRTETIPSVGVAPGWPGREAAGLEGPAPFDEPVLGVLGMWTLGGGPNPYSALTLAGVCERIGQRSVAWSGYQRALGLAERFHPAAREALVAHCRERQSKLEADAEHHAKLQAQHEAELAFGLLFQEQRAKHEEERLAAGADLDDPDFFVAFERDFESKYGPIASPIGRTDRARVALDRSSPRPLDLGSVALLAFGLGAALGLLRR